MISDYVMTEHNCRASEVAADPVGLAAYGMDSHNTQRYVDDDGHARNEGDVQVDGFQPLRDLLPLDRAQGRRVHEPAGAGLPVGHAHRLRLDPHGAGVHGARPIGRHRRLPGHRRQLTVQDVDYPGCGRDWKPTSKSSTGRGLRSHNECLACHGLSLPCDSHSMKHASTVSSIALVYFCVIRLSLAAGAAPAAGSGPVADAGKITFTIPRDAARDHRDRRCRGRAREELVCRCPVQAGNAHCRMGRARRQWPARVARRISLARAVSRRFARRLPSAFQYGDPPWFYGKTGGWTGDHSYAVTVATAGDRVLLGSTEAEWGHGVVAADLDGHKVWGQRWLNKKAWAGGDAFVSDGRRVFATSYPDINTVWEIDPANGDSWFVVELADLPKDRVNTEGRLPGLTGPGLRVVGARQTAAGDGELYVADLYGKQVRTYVFSTVAAKPGPNSNCCGCCRSGRGA